MRKFNYKVFILPALFLFCTVFYYFGELVDWAAWNALRANFFYGVHDIHRLLFMAPIIYAGYYNRVGGAVIITLMSLVVFLPRAFFISPYPDPLLRMLIFVVFAGVIGVFVGVIRNQADRLRQQ
jgi:ABC-type spermidine/putrescine transport system permease subunit I